MTSMSGAALMESREAMSSLAGPRPEHEVGWVQRLRAQDPEAFRELFRREARHIHAVVRRLAARREEVEDLVQETFVEAWKSLPKFRGQSAPGTWLHRVAVNTCVRHLRKRPLDEEPLDEDSAGEESDRAASPDEALLQTDLKDHVSAALDRLPVHARQVVVLHELEGMTFREVAKALGIPVGTAKSRLFHALRKLRELLEPYVTADDSGQSQVMA